MNDGHPVSNDVIRALEREWRPAVARFVHGADDEVEEALQDAMAALVTGPSPRALAPDGVVDPKVWRRTVLKRHLIDRHRRRSVRAGAEEAYRKDLAPSRRREAAAAPARAPESVSEVERHELWSMRERVVLLLPRLVIRRRITVALTLSIDPSPWASEIAWELDDDIERVLVRIDAALDGRAEPHRVLYPDDDEPPDVWRRTLQRAVDQLRSWLEAS